MSDRRIHVWAGLGDREMIDGVVRRVVHDLNNLTTATLGYAQLAAHTPAGDEISRSEALAAILEACEQSAGLTRALDLLGGSDDDTIDRYSVTETLHEFLPVMRRLLPGVDVPLQLGDGVTSPDVPGSPRQLLVALVALSVYLRRASLAGATIVPAIRRVGARLELAFRISGRTPAASALAYSELELAHTLLREEGAGLDLEQDGEIERIHVHLNVEAAESAGPSPPAVGSEATDRGAVLVVEPRQPVRDVMKTALHAAGLHPDCRARIDPDDPDDLDGALAAARLLVLSLEGDDGTGRKRAARRLERLRAARPDLPVIAIVSAGADLPEDVGVEILRRPFPLSVLTARVRAALEAD